MTTVTAEVAREVGRLDPAALIAAPRAAYRACRRLGGLARYWLTEGVLAAAAGYAPHLAGLFAPVRAREDGRPGDCWVVGGRADPLPLFGPGSVLPVRWRPRSDALPDHSPDLPDGLRALAGRVRDDLGRVLEGRKADPAGWVLDWSDQVRADPVRLAVGADVLPVESGWAAAAVGLLSAVDGLGTDLRVWASGRWGAGGLGEVGLVREKLLTAARMEATAVFVPVWQAAAAAGLAPPAVAVRPLAAPADRTPATALRDYLAAVTRRPPPPDPAADEAEQAAQFARCRAYYLTHPAARDDGFYPSHLLPAIARRFRAAVDARHPGWAPTHLTTVVSLNWAVAFLAAAGSGARRVLLLHTDDPKQREAAETCRRRLAGWWAERQVDGTAELVPFPRDGGGAAIAAAHARFVDGVAAGRAAVDLKPGTKRMTYDMSRLARPGDWLFNFDTRFLPDAGPDPGTEVPEVWQEVG